MSAHRKLHDYLDISAPPERCDAIFVLAGKRERKTHGIELWRSGLASELILSVGRFEWRAFYSLGLPGDGGLRRLVDATPPVDRHFFVRFGPDEAEAVLIRKGRFGTMTEARGLARFLRRRRQPHSLMVVSSAYHLRRTALAFRRAFRGTGVRLVFVAAPDQPETTSELFTELWKLAVYRLLLW